MKVRPAKFSDSAEIVEIWNPYIKKTFVTFNASEKTQEEGSIPRRLVAKACIEALKTKDSIKKIVEITSSEKNPKTNTK